MKIELEVPSRMANPKTTIGFTEHELDELVGLASSHRVRVSCHPSKRSKLEKTLMRAQRRLLKKMGANRG